MPSSLKQWISTPDAPVRELEIGARTGGHLRVTCAVGGQDWRLDAEFLEVVPDRLLRFTWVASDCPASAGSEVRVEFRPAVGGATEVVLTQTGFPDEAKRAGNEQGWTELLGQVEALLARRLPLRAEAHRPSPG